MQDASLLTNLPNGVLLRREILDRLIPQLTSYERRYIQSELQKVKFNLDIVPSLPWELSIQILSTLDPVDICILRRVSKRWATMLGSSHLLWTLMDLHFPGECHGPHRHKLDPKTIFWKKSKRWLSFSRGRPYRSAVSYHCYTSQESQTTGLRNISYKSGRIAWIEDALPGMSIIQIYHISSASYSRVIGKEREGFHCLVLSDSVLAALTFRGRCCVARLNSFGTIEDTSYFHLPGVSERDQIWCNDRAVLVRRLNFKSWNCTDYYYDIQTKTTREIPISRHKSSIHLRDPLLFPVLAAKISMLEDISKFDQVEADELSLAELSVVPESAPLRRLGGYDFHDYEARFESIKEHDYMDMNIVYQGVTDLIRRDLYASDFGGRLTLWSKMQFTNYVQDADGMRRVSHPITDLPPKFSCDYFCQMIPGKKHLSTVIAPQKFDEQPNGLIHSGLNYELDEDCSASSHYLQGPPDMMLWKTCIYRLGHKCRSKVYIRDFEDEGGSSLSEISIIETAIHGNHHEERDPDFQLYRLLGDENFLVHVKEDGFHIYSFDEDLPLPDEDLRYYEMRAQFAEKRKQSRI